MTTAPMETPRVSPYLAAELRAEMGRKNMSQRQVALRLGRPPLWLSRRVGGTATVDLTLRARLVAAASTAEVGRRLRLVGAEGVNRGVTENRIPAGWPVPEPHAPLPAPESGYRPRHLRLVDRAVS
jgi:hypothetical protein